MKMIRRMGFVRRQKYRVYIFLEAWMDRKIAEDRELTLVESMALMVAYPIHWLVNPYS